MTDKKVGVPTKPTGATVKMGIKERLIIGGLLPQKGNLMEQRLARDIISKTELTQEDMTSVNMTSNPSSGNIQWDVDAERRIGNRKVHFSEAEVGFLKAQVKRLDEKKEISMDILEFCEKISNLNTEKEEDESP